MLRSVRRALAATPALAAAVLAGPLLPAAAGTARPAAARVFPQLESQYVRMPDGVRLAVDVWLPPGTTAGARLPAVLETDRYWRARAYTGGIKHNPNYFEAHPWNQRGYAYVFADLRGTGASFGTLTAELGRAMIKDVGSLADWIAARPWSNGRVGVTGVSYSADTAMLSLALRNPHITAAAPISYDFDPYEDLVRPGGILVGPRIGPYALLLKILDKAGGTTCATSTATRKICAEAGLTGAEPEPVDGPHGAALRAEARAQHFHNANLVQFAEAAAYRNDTAGPESWTVASVGSKTAAIGAGGVPILTFAGWLDAGTANGVLSQFTSLPNTQQAWIGPWSHGQGYIADPFQPSRPLTAAEHQQLNDQVYAFFDRYVKHDQRPDGRRLLHYYTLNEGTWRTTTGWPVPGTRMRRLDLAAGHTLTWRLARPTAPAGQSGQAGQADLLTLNRTAGTGPLDRWNTNFTGEPVVYPNRAAVDRKLLSYTTAPLPGPVRVTGLGRVTLTVTGLRGASHGALYAYLEDVQPDGRVVYVTEGELALADRALAPRRDSPAWRKLRTPRTFASGSAAPFPLHRPGRITFDLLPTSVLFRPGDRIRITIAAADPSSFQLLPPDGQASYLIGDSTAQPSYVELPVVR
jgi:putative CocE/NonD family hydrolase